MYSKEELKELFIGSKDTSILEVSIKVEALKKILDTSYTDGKDSLQANKYLLEYFNKDKKVVGRPTKEAIQREAKYLTDINSTIEEDYSRLFNK